MVIRRKLGSGDISYLPDAPVISLCSFGKEHLVFCELLLVWERNAIDSLQGIIGSITKEIRRRILRKVRRKSG
jgi:hypothetical protein